MIIANRVLIVDDERPIREWIALCLENMSLPVEVVGCAANGKEGYELFCQMCPDVIITDIRMPMMDGLELMKKVKEKDADVSFIILTCHEEFSYAREALKMGTEDYLLKTEISKEQLEKVFLKLQNVKNKNVNKEKIFLERQSFICSILNGDGIPQKEDMEKIGIFVEKKDFFVAMVKVKTAVDMHGAQEQLKVDGYQCFYFPYEKSVILTLVWIDRIPSTLSRIHSQQIFADRISGIFGGTIGISQVHDDVAKLKKAVEEAKQQLEMGFYKKGSINLEMLQKQRPDDEQEAEKRVRELKEQIYSLDRESLCDNLCQWIEKIGARRMMRGEVLKEECIFLMRGIKERYPALDFDKERISNADSYEALREIVLESVENLRNTGDSRAGIYMNSAVDYMKKNYRGNCSLEAVARHVGLNPDYFSRLFKSHMKKTFNTCLTEIRMEAAKRLLAAGEKSIGQIAEEVGYQNIAYFSKVFKKYTGSTPFHYKK